MKETEFKYIPHHWKTCSNTRDQILMEIVHQLKRNADINETKVKER